MFRLSKKLLVNFSFSFPYSPYFKHGKPNYDWFVKKLEFFLNEVFGVGRTRICGLNLKRISFYCDLFKFLNIKHYFIYFALNFSFFYYLFIYLFFVIYRLYFSIRRCNEIAVCEWASVHIYQLLAYVIIRHMYLMNKCNAYYTPQQNHIHTNTFIPILMTTFLMTFSHILLK